jgi:hypothetical protein
MLLVFAKGAHSSACVSNSKQKHRILFFCVFFCTSASMQIKIIRYFSSSTVNSVSSVTDVITNRISYIDGSETGEGVYTHRVN